MIWLLLSGLFYAALLYVLWRIGDQLQRGQQKAEIHQLLATFAPAANPRANVIPPPQSTPRATVRAGGEPTRP